MHCTIHPTTPRDVTTVVASLERRSETWEAEWPAAIEKLLDACMVSTQIWTAADREGFPVAFMGAAAIGNQQKKVGRVWFVILDAENDEDEATSYEDVVRQIVSQMLAEFHRLENVIDADKPWALDLFRRAGFTIGPAAPAREGTRAHQVWIDRHPGATLH